MIVNRRTLIATVLSGLLVLGASASAEDKKDNRKLDLDKIPKAVMDSLKAKFPKAEVKHVNKEIVDGKTCYEIGVNLDKQHFHAMVTAEELGISKANVDDHMKSDNPDVKRLLGTEGKHGEALGLTNDWAYRIVKQVGNYGEAFERNVGQGSPLKITRGLNALWNKGGLQYAPPIR